MAPNKEASPKLGKGARQVALLRGVNVGGKNRLAMKDLVAMLEAAGCRDVETYIQSGNAIFSVNAARAKSLRVAVERAIFEKLGNEIALVFRTALELRAVVRANPFLTAGANTDELYVAFLLDKPTAAQLATLDVKRSLPDEFAVRGQEIYLRLPTGAGHTKLTNTYFDRTLKTTSTMRNWRTVQALLERATG